jgi:hypothetical protein
MAAVPAAANLILGLYECWCGNSQLLLVLVSVYLAFFVGGGLSSKIDQVRRIRRRQQKQRARLQ